MVWRIDQSKATRCSDEPNYGRFPKYVQCIQSLLPRTEYAVFKDDGNNLEFQDFETEEFYSLMKNGYQVPCVGDSGSAHWVDTNLGRSVLVGISTHGSLPCGNTAYMQKTSDEQILQWIKQKADIIPEVVVPDFDCWEYL